MVVEHDLPGREQLEEIARGIATEEGELPEGPELHMVLGAASRLTRYEAEAAFSLSLVRHRQVRADAVWELKCQTLKKSGLLTLHRGGETFADLGGLESLKSFCSRALRHQGPQDPLKRAEEFYSFLHQAVAKASLPKVLAMKCGVRPCAWISAR